MRRGQDTLFGAPRGGRDGQVGKVDLASGGQQKMLSDPSLLPLSAPYGVYRPYRRKPVEDGSAEGAGCKCGPVPPAGDRQRGRGELRSTKPGCWCGELRLRKGPCQAHALRPACRAKRSVLHLPLLRLRKRPVTGGPLCGAWVGGGVLPRRSGCGATSPTNALCAILEGWVVWLCHPTPLNATQGHKWGDVASDERTEFSVLLAERRQHDFCA